MSSTVHKQPRPETPPLLHNTGYAPQARLIWRGMNRSEISDGQKQILLARRTGTWLNCRHFIRLGDPLYTHDWNNARALLRVLEPGHGLAEAQARQALVDRIESHCAAQDWPAYLVTEPLGYGAYSDSLTLDHPLTAFLALAKSTGSLWMRDRPTRLSALHTPIGSQGTGSATHRCIQWSVRLWFPTGVPENLLAALKSALPGNSPTRAA